VRLALIAAAALAVAVPVAGGGIFEPLKPRAAPALWGVDPVTGKHVSLAQWKGKPLLVHLWRSWCRPCREEAPTLRAFLARHPRSVLGIDIEDSKAGARTFQKRYRLSFPNIFDPSDVMANRLGAPGSPTTYFLDRRHRTVAVVFEPATAAQLERGWKLARS